MEKKEAIRRWQNLDADQDVLSHFTPIPADAKGSTFGACGIRISGNPQFIDAVLSRLKDLLAAEAGTTRLSLSRQPVKAVSIKNGDSVVDKKWNNADEDAETCYIQIRERTACSRQRKVREQSSPLPHLDDAEEGHNAEDPAPAVNPVQSESHVHATIGGLSTGEVLWEEETEENAVEEGRKW